MPLLDQDPIDPEIAATLDAIDATLAGEPVDGRYAEIAEIALLLASDRPEVPPAFAQSLDGKVERRFAPLGAPKKRGKRNWSRAWQAVGAVAATGVAVVAAVAFVGGGGGSSSVSSSSASESVTSAASSAASSPPAYRSAKALSSTTPSSANSASSSGSAASSSGSVANGASAGQPLQPPTTGRKVVQGAQLNLTTAANRIDDVAQEIYNLIGQVNGIVQNSSVTQGGPGGNASFELSVPSGSLGQTMTALSSLNYAQVVSRTDSSQDITDQYGAATRALADARALRTSLLKQLANAVTTEQVDSITAQIHDAEASISSDQATLNGLNHQVNYSQVYVSVQARVVPPPVTHGSGGFTIGKAAHDAGHVLTVVAGVALIALAALTPIALVIALAWWVGLALRRRRREQALDSV
ncbi:MAG: DUF4349 domain-containing protein [Solirubrobacteraceae bacterium]